MIRPYWDSVPPFSWGNGNGYLCAFCLHNYVVSLNSNEKDLECLLISLGNFKYWLKFLHFCLTALCYIWNPKSKFMENTVGWKAYATFIIEYRDFWAYLEGQQGGPQWVYLLKGLKNLSGKKKKIIQTPVSTSQVWFKNKDQGGQWGRKKVKGWSRPGH